MPPPFFTPLSHPTPFAPRAMAVLCALALASLLGCSDKPAANTNTNASAPATGSTPNPAATASAPAGPPAQPVTVSTVKAQTKDMAVTLKATGLVMPLRSVDVRPQVNSTVSQVHFSEGQFVQAGQLLFTLDARTDEANLAKARAQLNKDNASLADARRQYERAQQLMGQNFISQGALDTSRAQMEALAATVAADQAAVSASQVAVSYSRITAPQSGRVGAVNVFPGSSVAANQTTLVSITQLDPIAVQFSIPQNYLESALSALQSKASVSAKLPEGKDRITGRLQFLDNAIDANSGAVKAKAVFENKDNKLWPGAFVEVQQTIRTLKNAVVVPQSAIIVGTRGTVVYVVQEGKAVMRPVEVLYAENDQAAVSGVNAGDVVVQDGKQNLRPNSPVVERPPEAKGKDKAADKSADKGADKGADKPADKTATPSAAPSAAPSAPAKPATP